MIGWFHLRSSGVIQVPTRVTISFSSKGEHLLCTYRAVCLATHLSVRTGAASIPGLLWVMLLWTWVHKYLFKCLLSILGGTYPEERWLDPMVGLCLIVGGTSTVFLSGCTILHPCQQCARFLISPHPCQHLRLFYLLYSSHPNARKMVKDFFSMWPVKAGI